MAATAVLDDPATPVMLQKISEDMEEARYLDERGRLNALTRELGRICSKIRSEMHDLRSPADPDLLIVLWSTAQISHADGLEYAKTHSRPDPDSIIPQ